MRSGSIEETYDVAKRFVGSCKPAKGHATVVGLRGELGSGKTTFTKGAAEALGITEHITSPTFVIMKRYALHDSRFENLIHVDAYRLMRGEELAALRWSDVISKPGNLVLVEWPERVEDIMPKHTHFIDFTFISETEREIGL